MSDACLGPESTPSAPPAPAMCCRRSCPARRGRGPISRASPTFPRTVAQRLGVLFAAGLLQEAEETQASGGRPARVLKLNEDFGVVLAADIGESHIRVAATDLGPNGWPNGLASSMSAPGRCRS